MNNTYRLVWNATLGLWQAAPETAKGRGKNKSSRALRPLHALAALALASSAQAAMPLPSGGKLVAGEGSITEAGKVMTIDQASGKMAIDWQSFSIGQGNTVIFRQPSTTAVALNRVLGPEVSTIQGALRANGQVFLLNPNGVLFSPTAQVNVGGLLASTLGMQTGDFMAGRYQLEGGSTHAVVNQGTLQADTGGVVALVAARVTNSGTIDTPGGSAALGAGSRVLVDLGGPVKLQVQQAAVDTLVDNGGAIRADGGTVLLTAAAASELAGSVINQSGTIRAQTLATGARGEILLLGDMQHGRLHVGGTLDASAPAGGDGGFIETSAAHVATASGLVIDAGAAKGKGGQWLVDPFDYVINAAAADTISRSLDTGTSVTITTQAYDPDKGATTGTSGDITLNSAITKSAGGDATLTLQADRNVIVGAGIGSTSGKLGITLSAGHGGGAYGGVRVNGNLTSNGGDILIGGARGKPNQGIGFAANLNSTEPAVSIEQNKAIFSAGGNITINGLSTVASKGGTLSGTAGGIYVKSGASILSGTGDLYLTGESTASKLTFGIAFEANAGTKTVVGSATNGGNMLMNAVNSSAGTAAERDEGAMGLTNNGGADKIAFYGPSVASWLVFINGRPQLSGYTRAPQLNCAAGYLNCGYLLVPGSNNSYLYARYEAVNEATNAAYVIQSGAGTKVYDGTTLATGLTLDPLGGPTGFKPSSLQPAPLFHTATKNTGTYSRLVRDAANPTTLVAGGVTYAVGYFNSGTYAITPRALTPVVADKVYDGTATAAVTAEGIVRGDDVRLVGSGSFGGTQVGQYTSVSAGGISLSGTDAANYALGGSATGGSSARILPREVTLAAQKTYDGSSDLSGAVVIGNLVAGEDLSYSGAAANSIHADGATHVGAIVLGNGRQGAASNYVLPVLGAASPANTAAITPRTLTVQLTDTGIAKTYDGTAAAPAGYQPGYSVTGLAEADRDARVVLTHTGAAYNSANVAEANRLTVSGLAVGALTDGVANARDYVLDAASKDVAARIAARSLTVSVDTQSKTYGNADPALTWRVVDSSLVGTDTLSGMLSRAAGENVGSYAIDASGLFNPNYAISATGANLTVTPRAIGIAANGGSKVYGDADPALTWRVVDGNLVGSDTLSGALARAAGENVGSYAIDASGLFNPNYAISATGANLTVTPRAIGIAANGGSKVYGDADPALTWRVVDGNLVGSDTLSGALARAAGENVGSYAIDASALFNPNYAISATGANLTVTPRAIGIAANGGSKVYGDADPSLTWRVVDGNLVGSDTLSGMLSRAAGENVGSYAIDASGLFNPNYAISATGANLTVTPRAIGIAANGGSKVYGDADPSLTWRVVDGNLVGTDTLSGALARAAGENVGSYAIDASGLFNPNYAVSATGANLTVTPRAIGIAANGGSKVYGDADPSLTWRVVDGNLVGSDTLSGMLSRAAGENVGSYAIDASALFNPNYTVSATGASLTVTPRAIGIAANGGSKVYGDADPSLTWRVVDGNLVGSDTLSGMLSRAAGENVGSYAIDASGLFNPNYTVSATGASLTVTPRAIGIAANGGSKVYGDADPSLTWRVVDGNLVGSDTLHGALSRAAGENVGSYAIDASGLFNPNYAISATNASLTVTPRAVEIAANGGSKVYGDADPSLTWRVVDGSLVGSDTLSGILSRSAGENVGSYAIDASGLFNPNYAISATNASLTVTPRAIGIAANGGSKVYGDADPSLTWRVVDGNLVGSDTLSGMLSRAAGENVGSYAIDASGLFNPNYAISATGANLTVTPRAIGIAANGGSKVYGDTDPALTWRVVDGNLVGTDTLSGALARAAGENVGSYAIDASALFNPNYAISATGANLTVTPRAIGIAANGGSKVYGDADPSLTWRVVDGNLVGTDTLHGALSRAAGENVGSYAIDASGLFNPNYAISATNASLTVTPRAIGIAANGGSKVYGDADPSLTWRVVDGNLVGSDTLQGALSRAAGENVGSYAIDASALFNPNYTVSATGASLTVTPRAIGIAANGGSKVYGDADPALTWRVVDGSLVGSDTLSGMLSRAAGENVGSYAIDASGLFNPNYAISATGASLTVTPRAIGIAANGGSKVYGDADPSLTWRVVDGNLVGSDTLSGALARAAGENVGSYAIDASGLFNPNYAISATGANLTVTPRAIGIAANGGSKVYGDADPSLTWRVVDGNLVGSDTLSGMLSRAAGENVGSYAIDASGLFNPNYAVSATGANLTVTPRAIGIAANGGSKVYGDADPSLTWRVVDGNLVGSDTLHGALSRAAGENVGSYAIDASALFNPNYAISATGANLTVTPRAIGIAANGGSKVYGDADPALTWRVVDGNLVGTDTLSGALARAAGENVGSYAIDASSLFNPNYAISATGASLTVTPRAIGIAANGGSKVYGDADPSLTWRVVDGNLVGSDTLSGILSRAAGENVGSYAIDASALFNPNYAISTTGANLTVTPRAIGIAANGGSKVYGDADPSLTWRVVDGNLVGSDTLHGALSRAVGENVGSYAIDASALFNPNYAISATGANLTVTPRAIGIAANGGSKVYGDADPSLTWRVVDGSLVGSDTLSGILSRAAGENVGSYAIDASGLFNPNYAVSATGANLTVTPRAIGIAANGGSKVYGDTDPALTWRVVDGNLVGTDTLSGALARAAGENVGSYAIDASALFNPNYTVSATNASLTVTPRAVEIAANGGSKVYGDADPSLTWRVVGGSLVGTDTLSGSLKRAAGDNVGSYVIDASGLANGNYVVTAHSGVLTVAPRPLSVLFEAQDKVYGDADPLPAYRIAAGSLVAGDTLKVVRAAGENVGSYAIDAVASPNYLLSSTPSALTIRPRPLAVTVSDAAKVYGDADPVLGYRIVAGSLVNGDLLGGALLRTPGENAGSYTIGGGTLANGNYVLTVKDGTLSIAARPIAVSADSQSKLAGSADPQLTWRITDGSLVGNDTLAGQLARAAGEQAGRYAIGQGTLGNANYAIAFNSASLDIAAAPQPIPQPIPQPVPQPAPVTPAPAPVTPAPAPVTPAPARPAIDASQYTALVPQLVPPTVGALSYVMVSDNSATTAGDAGSDADGATLERAASHAPTSGRDVKFLDVMVVSGGINTGAAAAPAPGD